MLDSLQDMSPSSSWGRVVPVTHRVVLHVALHAAELGFLCSDRPG